MAYTITGACTRCGDCLSVCPNGALRASPPEILPELCTECLGYAESPECVAVCPEGAIEVLEPAVPRWWARNEKRHRSHTL